MYTGLGHPRASYRMAASNLPVTASTGLVSVNRNQEAGPVKARGIRNQGMGNRNQEKSGRVWRWKRLKGTWCAWVHRIV